MGSAGRLLIENLGDKLQSDRSENIAVVAAISHSLILTEVGESIAGEAIEVEEPVKVLILDRDEIKEASHAVAFGRGLIIGGRADDDDAESTQLGVLLIMALDVRGEEIGVIIESPEDEIIVLTLAERAEGEDVAEGADKPRRGNITAQG